MTMRAARAVALAGFTAAVVDPGRALVLRGTVPVGRTPPFDFTWAFTLASAGPSASRLVVRERYHYLRWFAPLMVELTEIVSFIMSQKMLRGIRHRAVHHGGDARPAPSDARVGHRSAVA